MVARGVKDARHGSPAQLEDGPYDQILMLMHGLGIAGDAEGLRGMLADLRRLVAPGGCVLADSRDPGDACDQAGLGVAEIRLEYAGRVGPPFPWLFASAEVLAALADGVGWDTEVVLQDEGGRYLARLSPR